MTDLVWGHRDAPLHLTFTHDAPVALGLAPVPELDPADRHAVARPAMVEIVALGSGRDLTSVRLDRGSAGERLRHVAHRTSDDVLEVEQAGGGLATLTRVARVADAPAYRVTTTVRNIGGTDVVLQAVATVALRGLCGFLGPDDDTLVWTARNEWCAENRWSSTPLTGPAGLPDIDAPLHGHAGRGMQALTSTSTWSAGEHLPVAALSSTTTGRALVWQVENNGPWRWEITSQYHPLDLHALVLSGPTDLQHAWTTHLAPGEEFTTVPASFALGTDGLDSAVAALTAHRRASRLPATADVGRPLVYNDYMNTLMGDPTAERLLPLVDAAADAGAEVFCIDAGWYAGHGRWWSSVGEWTASTVRFGDLGLAGVVARIRQRGMRPGLWIEPEVVGVDSPVARTLPEECFMRRHGRRIVEHSRYFLDLRSPRARAHLDAVLDRMVTEYGAQYVKWDYNVTPGSGPDTDASGPGEGLLGHTRALLDWVDALRRRHPRLVVEGCASGAQRVDGTIVSRVDLLSTSDQQDPLRYPPIAAAAPMVIPPEQAASWAYPQPGMTSEEVAFTLVTGLSGRMYLSGHLDRLAPDATALVREAVAVYPAVVAHHAKAVPAWPLGLPAWRDPVVVLATRTPDATLLAVWNRGPATDVTLPLPWLTGRDTTVTTVFPASLDPWPVTWDARRAVLTVEAAAAPSARLLRLTHPA